MTKTGLEIIGFFVWWSVHNLRVKKAEVVKALADLGFTYKIPEVPLRSIFLEALRIVKTSHASEGLMVRPINKGNETYVFGLVDERVDKGHETLNYVHSATLKFNKETGAITCDNINHRLYKPIKETYEELKEYYTSDNMRKILFDILDNAHIISVRQHGGIYFVPAACGELVEKIEKLLNQLPGDCYLAVAPQIDQEKTKASIYKAFIAGLREKIVQYKLELEEEGGLTQKAALRTRLEEFKKLRDEISFYSNALSFQARDLDAELAGLNDQVKQKLFNAAA